MIIASSSVDAAMISRSDVLVVGSGPVGLTIAATLEKYGRDVTVLEAGEHFLNESTRSDLEGFCSGVDLPGLVIGRARQVGGGLNLWGGQLAMLEDYDLRRDGTDDAMRWPIGHADLYSGIGDVLKILGDEQIELSRTLEPIREESLVAQRYGLKLFQTSWLKYPKLKPAFWRHLRQSRSIKLVYGIACASLDYDSRSKCVKGVIAVRNSGERVACAANVIVLAAGAIENARLLLLPSSSGVFAPWSDNRWLGCGFSEHIDATTARIEIISHTRLNDIFDPVVHQGLKYTPKVTWTSSGRTERTLSACGMLVWPGYSRNAITELISLASTIFARGHVESVSEFPIALACAFRQITPLAYRYVRQRRIGSFTDRNAHLRVSVEQPVRPLSKITLSKDERDRHGIPRVVVNWIRGKEELKSLNEFTATMQRWLEGEGIAYVHTDQRLAANDLAFFEDTNDGLHHSGTTRMGTSPLTSVVGPDLRVHGTSNLYVCGASSFPSGGYANPTLTGMALAARLARTLAGNKQAA